MKEKKCVKCAWSGDRIEGEETVLVCRFNPPSPVRANKKKAAWPIVKPDDWCKRFQSESETEEQ